MREKIFSSGKRRQIFTSQFGLQKIVQRITRFFIPKEPQGLEFPGIDTNIVDITLVRRTRISAAQIEWYDGTDRFGETVLLGLPLPWHAVDIDFDTSRFARTVVRNQDVLPLVLAEFLLRNHLDCIVGPFVDQVNLNLVSGEVKIEAAALFDLPPVVVVETNLGNIPLELTPEFAPVTVPNFLRYVDEGLYVDSFIHRSAALQDGSPFIIQGGGFFFYRSGESPVVSPVPTYDPIINEPNVSNVRGTIAMAKLGGDPNSATSQWFLNLSDNGAILDDQNGGFTVFGRVVHDGMDVVGGAGISLGPRNLLGHAYMGAPISITVEGANILTRTLMIFGQGAIRCHPFALDEITAMNDWDVAKFDRAFWGHIGHVVRNGCRAKVLGLTRGALAGAPNDRR